MRVKYYLWHGFDARLPIPASRCSWRRRRRNNCGLNRLAVAWHLTSAPAILDDKTDRREEEAAGRVRWSQQICILLGIGNVTQKCISTGRRCTNTQLLYYIELDRQVVHVPSSCIWVKLIIGGHFGSSRAFNQTFYHIVLYTNPNRAVIPLASCWSHTRWARYPLRLFPQVTDLVYRILYYLLFWDSGRHAASWKIT